MSTDYHLYRRFQEEYRQLSLRSSRLRQARLDALDPRAQVALDEDLDGLREQQRDLERRLDQIRERLKANGWRLGEGEPADGAPQPPDPDGPLPEPGARLASWRLPLGRNALFTGRQQELQAIARDLLSPAGASPVVAINGWGGAGKTQLAVEFAYRYGRFFPGGVYWLNAATNDALQGDIVDCGLTLGLQPWPPTPDAQVAAVLRVWRQKDDASLVVLDNLEDLNLARHWLSELGYNPIRIVFTSRRTDWPPDLGLHLLELRRLPRQQSMELLQRLAHRGDDVAPGVHPLSDAQFDLLADRLGDLPLALDLAGRYLRGRPSVSAGDLAAELQNSGDALAHTALAGWVEMSESPTGHATSLPATFMLSWQRLDTSAPVDGLATYLYRCAGFCAAGQPIPREVFFRLGVRAETQMMAEAGGSKPAAGATLDDGAAVDKALWRLDDLGLLAFDTTGATLHPLLAEFSQRLNQEDHTPLQALVSALNDLAAAAIKSGLIYSFAPIRPHAEAAATAATKANLAEAVLLWAQLGNYYQGLGDEVGSRRSFGAALLLQAAVGGEDDLKIADRAVDMAVVLARTGKIDLAQATIDKALHIHQTALGPTHPQVASDLLGQGDVLLSAEHPDKALDQYEQAITMLEGHATQETVLLAAAYSRKGALLQAQGAASDARQAYERAVALGEQSTPLQHANLGRDMNNLALLLREAGELAGAETLCRKALQLAMASYGPDHLTTGVAAYNLGTVLLDLGKLTEATKQLDHAQRIFTGALPPDHPHRKRLQEKLAQLEQAKSKASKNQQRATTNRS